MGDNKWYVSDVKVNFKTKTDDVNSEKEYSGVKSYGFDKTSFPHEKTQTEDVSNITYTGYIIDNAGNENTCTITFKKDATKPTCELQGSGTVGENKWYISNVGISFKEHKDNLSGVSTYGLDSYTGDHKATLKTDTKSQGYKGYIKDKAGNTNNCSITVKRDTEKPSCTIKVSGTVGKNKWYTSNVDLSFNKHSDETSGVASYGFDSVTGSKTARLTSDTTSITYTGHIKDKAGHTATCKKTIKKDATPPTCSLTKVNTWETTGVDFSLKCSDGTSKVADCGGSTSTTVAKNNKKSTVTYTVEDKAGNKNSCSGQVSSSTDYRRRTRYWSSCITGSACGSSNCSSANGSRCSNSPYVSGYSCTAAGGGGNGVTCYSGGFNYYCVLCKCVNTCQSGYSSWSGWSGYAAGNYCNTTTCQSESRTRYY